MSFFALIVSRETYKFCHNCLMMFHMKQYTGINSMRMYNFASFLTIFGVKLHEKTYFKKTVCEL